MAKKDSPARQAMLARVARQAAAIQARSQELKAQKAKIEEATKKAVEQRKAIEQERKPIVSPPAPSISVAEKKPFGPLEQLKAKTEQLIAQAKALMPKPTPIPSKREPTPTPKITEGIPAEKILAPVSVEFFKPLVEKPKAMVTLPEKEIKREPFPVVEKAISLLQQAAIKAGEFFAPTYTLFGKLPAEAAKKELETLKKEGYFIPVTKKGEIIGGKWATPPEATIIKGIQEKEAIASQTEQSLIQKYKADLNVKAQTLIVEGQNQINAARAELQGRVDRGKISVEKANRELENATKITQGRIEKDIDKMEKEANVSLKREFIAVTTPKFQEITGRTEKQSKEETETYRTKIATATIVPNIISGVLFAGVSAIPILGQAVMYTTAASAVAQAPQIVQAFKEAPLASTIQFGSFIVGGAIGGGIVKGIKGIKAKNEFLKAAEKSEFRFAGVSVERATGKMKAVIVRGVKIVQGKTFAVETKMPVIQTKSGAIIPKGGRTTVYSLAEEKIKIKIYEPYGKVKAAWESQAAAIRARGGIKAEFEIPGAVTFGKLKLKPISEGEIALKEITGLAKLSEYAKGKYKVPEIYIKKAIEVKPMKGKPIPLKPLISIVKQDQLNKAISKISGVSAEKLRRYIVSGKTTVVGWKDPFSGKIIRIRVPKPTPQEGIPFAEKLPKGITYIPKKYPPGKPTPFLYPSLEKITQRLVSEIKPKVQRGISKREMVTRNIAVESAMRAITGQAPKITPKVISGLKVGAMVSSLLAGKQIAKERERYMGMQKLAQYQLMGQKKALAAMGVQLTQQQIKERVKVAQRVSSMQVLKPQQIYAIPPTIPIIPPISPPPTPLIFPILQEGMGFGRAAKQTQKQKAEQRRYQASVGAIALGLKGITTKELKQKYKKLTGLEIRRALIG